MRLLGAIGVAIGYMAVHAVMGVQRAFYWVLDRLYRLLGGGR